MYMRKTAIVLGHRIDVANWPSTCPLNLGTVQFRRDCPDNFLRYFVLQFENIFGCTVKSIRPKMGSSRGVDKLSGNPHATTGLADATFKHIVHTKLASYLLDVDGFAFVSETTNYGR